MFEDLMSALYEFYGCNEENQAHFKQKRNFFEESSGKLKKQDWQNRKSSGKLVASAFQGKAAGMTKL